MKSLLIAAALASVTTVQAQTLVYRSDSVGGSTTHTYALMTKNVEFWAFAPDSKNPDLEVGHLWPVRSPKGTWLYAGGYYAVWTGSHQHFALPFVAAGAKVGKVNLAGSLGLYLPLNGGPRVLCSNEMSAMLSLDRKVQVGMASSFWSPDGQTTYRIGPKVSADLGSGKSLNLRYLRGPSVPDSFRMELRCSF